MELDEREAGGLEAGNGARAVSCHCAGSSPEKARRARFHFIHPEDFFTFLDAPEPG